MVKPVKVSDRKTPWFQRNFNRKMKIRPARERILIVCEGERTEPNYFKAIGSTLPPHVVELKVEGPGMNTISLVREAIRLRDKEIDSSRPYDQTWAVFDKDDFPADDFDNAITMCKQHGLKAAYSNQAFELWFVLHFEDRQSGMHRDQYKDCLTGHLGETYFKKDAGIYGKVTARGSESEAIRRAKRLVESAPHPPSVANPSTTVFELVEKLSTFKRAEK